jgi:hypothetical protein
VGIPIQIAAYAFRREISMHRISTPFVRTKAIWNPCRSHTETQTGWSQSFDTYAIAFSITFCASPGLVIFIEYSSAIEPDIKDC